MRCVANQAGVEHPCDALIALKMLCNGEGGLILPPHPQLQRLNPVQQQIGGERRQRRSGELAILKDRRHKVTPADQHAPDRIVMSSQELRRAVDDGLRQARTGVD